MYVYLYIYIHMYTHIHTYKYIYRFSDRIDPWVCPRIYSNGFVDLFQKRTWCAKVGDS